MIRIKLAIADTDEIYVNRLSNFFDASYRDRLEVYSFTQSTSLMNFINTNKVDVLLASDVMEIDLKAIPERTAFAYLVDSPSLETVNNKRTVCKFQKADLIYKEALSLYSENPTNVTGFKSAGDGDTSVISYYSCSGGCGSSTVAAACCINLASKGKRVLYLNLEHFGTSQTFFNATGSFTLSDVIFALKSKKSNLTLKLESAVRKDQSGVFFYEACRNPLDIFEMTSDEIRRLIVELKSSGNYDFIIIDTDVQLDTSAINIMSYSNSMIFVSDGSEVANIKFKRAYNAMTIIEEQQKISLIQKIIVMNNKFHPTTSKANEEIPDVEVIGGIADFGRESNFQIAKQISQMQVFSSLC